MGKAFTLLIFFFSITINYAQNCENIPNTFSSYNKALSIVKKSDFSFKENITTSKSSWIMECSFYSCNSKIGFLVITTNKKKYIFQNVPIEVWKNFKEADSFGRYYNKNIKNHYNISLN